MSIFSILTMVAYCVYILFWGYGFHVFERDCSPEEAFIKNRKLALIPFAIQTIVIICVAVGITSNSNSIYENLFMQVFLWFFVAILGVGMIISIVQNKGNVKEEIRVMTLHLNKDEYRLINESTHVNGNAISRRALETKDLLIDFVGAMPTQNIDATFECMEIEKGVYHCTKFIPDEAPSKKHLHMGKIIFWGTEAVIVLLHITDALYSMQISMNFGSLLLFILRMATVLGFLALSKLYAGATSSFYKFMHIFSICVAGIILLSFIWI